MNNDHSPSSSPSFPDSLDPIQRRNHEESKRLAIAASDAAKKAERELAEAKSAAVARYGLPNAPLDRYITSSSAAREAHALLSKAADKIAFGEVFHICNAIRFTQSPIGLYFRGSIGALLEGAINKALAEKHSSTLEDWMACTQGCGYFDIPASDSRYLRLAWIDAMQFQLENLI